MLIVYSKNAVPIRITQERWGHIIHRHPEMDLQKEKVEETITEPDFIQEGDFGEFLAIRFFRKTPLTQKYLVVVYREVSSLDGFVMTAYFTNSPLKGRRGVWKR